MAIRNNKLGGQDWDDEILFDFDLNDTFDTTIDKINETKKIGIGVAQNAYQTLKQSGSFDNKDFLAADEFIDSNGINNTINLTSTNSIFNTNYYELSRNYDLSSHTTVNNGNNINPENFFDFNKNTYAYYKSANNPAARTSSLGKIFPQQYYITTVEIKVQIYIIDHSDSNSTVKLQKYDGNNWIDVTTLINQSSNGTFTYDNIYNFYDYAYGLRIIADTVDFSSTSHERHRFFYFKYYYEYNQNSLVICDSNLLTLDGTEQSLSIYADKDIPENTDITVDVWDGTSFSETSTTYIENTTYSEDDAGENDTRYFGQKIQAKEDIKVLSVKKVSVSTAQYCYIYDFNYNLLEKVAFNEDIATFTQEHNFAKGEIFYILAGSDGNTYYRPYDNYSQGSHTFNYPIEGNSIIFLNGHINDNGNWLNASTGIFNILEVNTKLLNRDAITNKPINSTIDISSLGSGNLSLTFNLSTTDTLVTPKLYGYGVYIMR